MASLNSGIVPIFKTETRKMGDGDSPASVSYQESKSLPGTTKQTSVSILFMRTRSNGHPLLQESLGKQVFTFESGKRKAGEMTNGLANP